MNIPTCYRCPERNRGNERCEILAAKSKSVKGLGLTSIKFNCDKRASLFAPGDVVRFSLRDRETDEPVWDWLAAALVAKWKLGRLTHGELIRVLGAGQIFKGQA